MENFENQNECQHLYECCGVCNLSTIKLSVPTHLVYLKCCYCVSKMLNCSIIFLKRLPQPLTLNVNTYNKG